ncbi:glycoside hydrolase family 28 protein [Mariniflexile sp. HMF6888]|uniref:glycoside hydrolase family 28 protein n=1 Tax=Mariniflexile sp. HMF6888 TaxID=3373086 RepID=UPI0037A1E610
MIAEIKNIKISINKLLLVFLCIGFQGWGQNTSNFIKNLRAPSLGVTSSTVLLLWDDQYEPNVMLEDYSNSKLSYDIYQDGVKIATANKHTYTVKDLSPEHNYSFSVCVTKSKAHKFLEENAINVTTKKAGKIFNVKDFGAVGNGKVEDTEAIQNAINSCDKGGTVLVPSGSYLIGQIELKSDMTFEIEKGAFLTFIGYDDIGVLKRFKTTLAHTDGDKIHTGKSLIYGSNIHDLTITGEGVLDANGETWWPHFPVGLEKVNGETRPRFLELVKGSNILVQGVTFQDSPKFNNVLIYIDNVIYSDVKILKYSTVEGRNGDGLDPYGSRNVTIVGCLFGNQDDSIALKGDGKSRFCENIKVLDCVFDGNAAPGASPLGFAIGSGCKVKGVLVKNCTFIDAASIANIKTKKDASYTFVEDVRVENITYINTKHIDRKWNHAPIALDQYYYAPEDKGPKVFQPLTPETPFFRNIQFKNIRINNPVGRGIYIAGFAELPIQQVSFTDMMVKSLDGFSIQNVQDISMQNVKVELVTQQD